MKYTGKYKIKCDVCRKSASTTTIWSYVWKNKMHGRCRKHLKD